MRPITNEDIKVLGRIVNISTENVVADASQVYDSNLQKDQQWINNDFNNKTQPATASSYGIVRLASNKNDNNNTDVPTIKIMRDAIQDAVDRILGSDNLNEQLDTIYEIAQALNDDESFYTWVTNQLALKANESEFRTLVARVNSLDRRVTELELCCQQVRDYMDQFSITWSPARGGSHVTISPSVLHAGRNTVTIDVEEGYAIQENLTQANIVDYVDGMYGTVTLSDITVSDSGNITSFQLDFTDVRSNVEINAHIKKYGTITVVVNDAHGTASPSVGQLSWNSSHVPSFWSTITPDSGYQISGSKFSVKDSDGIYLLTNEPIATTGSNANKVGFGSTIGATSTDAFENYIIEVALQQIHTISYIGMTSRFYSTNDATTVNDGASFSTNFIHRAGVMPGIYITVTNVTMGGVDITTQAKAGSHAVDIDHVTGNVVITVQENQEFFEFDGEVTINVSHGSASPNSVYSDGTSHTSTITPDSGYTLTGALVSSNNNEVTASLNGSTLTISGQSNNDTIITVTLPSSGTTPTYGTVTIDVPNGSASPSSVTSDGTAHTSTITADSGYTLTGATVSSNNAQVTASINGSTLTINGTSTNNTTVTVTLPAESAPAPNYGKAFINVVNAKLQPDSITSYTGPNDAANPQLPEYWTTYDGAKSVYSINSNNASTYKVMIEPPYDYMDPLDDSASSYDYLVTVDVRDANGNKVCTYTDSPNNNFYAAYGENEVVSNTIVNLQKSTNNSASDVLSGNIRYRKGSSIADRDENGNYTRAYRYIELNNIQSSIDLYITVTFYAGTGFTNYSRYMGHNNMASDDYVFSREAFSFNALGKYIDPMLPYDPSALDPNSQDTYFDVYGTPSYGNAYREINIGSINNIAGIAGSNESEKLADLKNKISFIYIKKFGLENGVEHKYNDFINTETSPNCPFTISASDITLDSNNNAILKVYCSATNPNNEIITDTYLCPTSFQYAKSGSTVSFKTTTIDQHIKDSYHVDQLIVMCDTTPIYTTRLVREIYGLIAISPNRNQPGTTFSETVWKPNRYYYLSPSTIFTAESGDTTSPDLQVDFYEHGTQTPASNMEYSISEHYIDAVITIDPVDNTYPSLTSKLENVDMVDGAPSIEINKMTIATS